MTDARKILAAVQRKALERSMIQQVTQYIRNPALVWRHCDTSPGQVRFHPVREWRFDIAETTHQLAIEVNGGQYQGANGKQSARHQTGVGVERDAEKFAEAAILGWTVLAFPTAMVEDGRAVLLVMRWFEARAREFREAERRVG
jgi:very-short-patch-repair endonuclease